MVPMTASIAAVMLLSVYGMIAKDGMKIRGFIPVFLERIPAMRTDMPFRVNQDRLLC